MSNSSQHLVKDLREVSRIKTQKELIKQLMFRIGELESENQELKYLLEQERKLSPETKASIKQQELYKGIKHENSSLREMLKKMRQERDNLICKVAQANKPSAYDSGDSILSKPFDSITDHIKSDVVSIIKTKVHASE